MNKHLKYINKSVCSKVSMDFGPWGELGRGRLKKLTNTVLKRTFVTLALGAVVATLSSCGQDRNLTDHRNAQVELELAKYRSVQGVYRGLAYQIGSRKPLGEIEIQLFANTVVDSDGLRREPRAVLQSYVTLRIPKLRDILVSMTTGFYLPQEKKLKTTVVADRSGISRTLQLEGNLEGNDKIKGVLSVFGYPNSAFEVEVNRNTAWPDLQENEFAADRSPYVPPGKKMIYKKGRAFYSDGKTQEAQLHLTNSTINSEGLLIDLLSPLRIFSGFITYVNSTFQIDFPVVMWDTDSNTLTGIRRQEGVNSGDMRLECQQLADGAAMGWQCTYNSSVGGTLRSFTFSKRVIE